jgi:hypothetical protein
MKHLQVCEINEEIRKGYEWGTYKYQMDPLEDVKHIKPYKRSVIFTSIPTEDIDNRTEQMGRSKFWFTCIPDNEIPFINNCHTCLAETLTDVLQTLVLE